MKIFSERGISLLAGTIMEALVGVNYAYSVFQQPLMQKYGWSIQETSFGYTFYFIMVLLSSLYLCNKIKNGMRIQKVVRLGAVFYSVGVLLMFFIQKSPVELYLYFGGLTSFGCIMISPSITSYAMELFPEKPGFAGGCTSAGYSLGAIIWAPMVSVIAEKTGDIKYAFLFLGILFFSGLFFLSFLLCETGIREAKERKIHHFYKYYETKEYQKSLYEVDKKSMLSLLIFYKVMFSLIVVFICGTMVITQAAPILQERFEMSLAESSLAVSLCAVTNTVGRSIWGWISDKYGQIQMLLITHIILILVQLVLLWTGNQLLFTLSLLGITFCFGGASSLVAPMTRKLFGRKNLEENYSVTFSSFAISGVIGSFLISFLKEKFDSFSISFIFCIVLSIMSIMLLKSSSKLERNG